MSQATYPRLAIVQDDRHTAAESNRDQYVLGASGAQLRYPDDYLSRAHAARR
jgi:hypothetical protein